MFVFDSGCVTGEGGKLGDNPVIPCNSLVILRSGSIMKGFRNGEPQGVSVSDSGISPSLSTMS
eukprot:12189164-Prorocentrum_lima.AAC.1